jgi:hypothetical protein
MPLPDRKTAFIEALTGSAVRLVSVPHPDRKVPEHAVNEDGTCVLRYSYGFHLPIDVTDAGVGCTLDFNKRPFPTYVPWAAVLALVEDETGAHMQWPLVVNARNMRPLVATTDAPEPEKPSGEPELPPVTRGGLSLVR